MAWDGPDATRPLSDKGRKQSKRLGEHLAGLGYSPDAVITSPKLRAAETAEIVAKLVGAKVHVDERLAGGLDLATVDAIVDDAGGLERVVLVGHDPDFSDLLSVLCRAAGATMRKGALAHIAIERPLEAGAGTLRWLIPPDALKPGR
jgi:phosphohistidine phosphatase